MGGLAAGQVALVSFPFSDLSRSKIRPAVVLADAGRGDWLLCQVTSNPYADTNAVALEDKDFASGSLRRISYARPGKLFTGNETIFAGNAGHLTRDAHHRIAGSVIALLQAALR